MHYLITGHTGFKGSWLALWLNSLGHEVSGISLDPIPNSLFDRANVSEVLQNDLRIDIRKSDEVKTALLQVNPDVVFHLAAQPLVRESYADPRYTFETNVMGTLSLLEAVSSAKSVKAHVVVTTDKVYRNINQVAGYVESDPLGGYDPYSSSKAMADLLTQSWISSFPGTPTTIVRAGNVIGGGDVSKDRLMPDLISAYMNNEVPTLRYPNSVRPWQHVLDCLNGYLMISESLLSGKEYPMMNIGPDKESFVTVAKVAELVASQLSVDPTWILSELSEPHEAGLLSLDASLAKTALGWHDKLMFTDAVKWTTNWYQKVEGNESVRKVTNQQIENFINL
ncbi:MAG: UDP-glucose 4-epimerase, GalE6, partial [Actinomycetota bacterium]|jgi:CDP-glucose 4,6-dehydratase